MKKIHFLSITLVVIWLIGLSSCSNDSLDSTFDYTPSVEEERVIGKRNCAVHEHMDQLLADPEYAKRYQNRMAQFTKVNNLIKEKAGCTTPMIIPVAIHYQGVNSPNKTCLIDLANHQINILNADYTAQNSDINKWANASSYFPGVSNGVTCVQFVIANTNHPTGFNLQNGDQAITVNQTTGDQSNKWSGYLNIFVQFNTGLLGYSPYGGAGNGDGVVIDANAFGSGAGCGSVSPDSPYNLGRTLTHEVGHYFLLDHIWGNGCNVDDEVADTPNQSSDYGGCPNLGESSCGSTDMHMNFMDYTDDVCMYMFSAGQALRMENYIKANLTNIINKASSVYNGSTDSGGGNNGGEDPIPTATCQAPTNSSFSIVSNKSVKVDWENVPDAIRYRIRYRPVGTTKWTSVNTNSSDKTISNLDDTKKYEYQLRTQCPSGWTSFGSIQTFDFSNGENGGGDSGSSPQKYTLKLTLDEYGTETTWYILDAQYNEIHKGGPYQDGQSGKVITQEIELTKGCYELELQDEYGDGICCEYGNGSAELLNAQGQRVAYLDGKFGTFDYIAFCVDGNGLRISKYNRDTKKLNRGSKLK